MMKTFHDFGEIRLDRGGTRLEHEFIVKNTTPLVLEIEKIKTSCGCVQATVADSVLQPGHQTTMLVAIDVIGVGVTQQFATVVFSDGMSTEYTLRAVGVRETQFSLSPMRHRITGNTKFIRVILQIVDRTGHVETVKPTVRAGGFLPPTSFDGWKVLEPLNAVSARPLRQVGVLQIDLTDYAGPFPVIIEIQTESGLAGSITVDCFAD